MLLATFFFAVMNVFVKLVPHIPAVEVVLFRSLISFVLSFVFLRAQHVSVWGNNKKILLSRGASGAFALILYFYTLQKMPLASAVTIQFLTPIFTSILGIIVVKERVRPLQWLFFLIAFAGVLVIRGFDPRITPRLMVIGVVAAVFAGLAYNFIRKLKQSEHPLVIVFYFPLVTIPVTAIFSIFNWAQPIGWEWGALLMIGIFTQIAQYFMTKAYQAEELSKISSLKYIGIIYALGFGWVFFKETYNLLTFIGMLIVMVGVVLNIYYKHRLTLKK